MKHFKVLSIAALAIIALLLSGCKKDEDPDQKPASMGVSASRLDYAADGGSQAIRFYSNRDWSAQINYSGDAKDWLTVTPNSAKAASDSITVSFTAKANEDGNIDMKEYESLQAEYNAIVEKGLKERNQLMELFGWKLNEEASAAQSGRAGAVRPTVTEETAGRLEGVANAQLDRVIGMDIKMESMSDNLSAMASSIATVAENSEYLKRLDDIADNIQNMNSTGVKIKN